MFSTRLSKLIAVAILALSTLVMLAASFDAEARRFGGGKSFGRQSSNVLQQRKAVKPPAANANRNTNSAQSNAARSGASQPKSGFSRFLGPIAGIAAGLGIAALLSSLGLGGALLEALSSMVLIALVIFAVMFLVRRFRGGAAKPAGATASPMQRQSTPTPTPSAPKPAPAAPVAAGTSAAAPASADAPQEIDPSWFIPENFDITSFLSNAKDQFRHIQSLWDEGNPELLRDYLTDDLLKEVTPDIHSREGNQETQIVLLNAELLGIEKVTGGHLASVRYSGMLREEADTEAFSFEEVWNLYKADDSGWLLAGIQQIDPN